MTKIKTSKAKSSVSPVLKALPAYFGGKRELISTIIELFQNIECKSNLIVDPMGGSMTIPLASKHAGFEVEANDRLYGPYVLGKGLVENNTHKIDINKVDQLLCVDKKVVQSSFINDTYGGVHLPYEIAKTADTMYTNIKLMNVAEQWVYLVLLYRFLIFMAPYQQYRYKALVPQFYAETYYKSMEHHIKRWREHIRDPLPTLIKFAGHINKAVCKGKAKIYQQDVFDFLDRRKKMGKVGGILYLDSPYAGATIPYEKGYGVADCMLQGKIHMPPLSVFNDKKKEEDALKRLLSYVSSYDAAVFSYWSKLHDCKWFETIFHQCGLDHRYVDIEHSYRYSTKIGVSNVDAGKRTDWSGERRKQAGAQEILYILTPR